MNFIAQVTKAMIEHEHGCPQRINHFLRVYGYAKTIAQLEEVDENTLLTVETVALMHDIGIKISLETLFKKHLMKILSSILTSTLQVMIKEIKIVEETMDKEINKMNILIQIQF